MPETLFLVPIEWLPSYGTEIHRLKSRTQRGASCEVDRLLENPGLRPKVPEGYTVMSSTQLLTLKVAIDKALLGLETKKVQTVAEAIEEYKATRGSHAVRLLHRVLDKLIGLKCGHCGKDVSVTIESP